MGLSISPFFHELSTDRLRTHPTTGSEQALRGIPLDPRVKKTWATRAFNSSSIELRYALDDDPPRVGDCVVVRVAKVSNHARVYTDDMRYSRLYSGDVLVGVFGKRYATDAFHADTIDLTRLHLLTNAGLIGTVTSRHSSTKSPTQVDLLGYLKVRQSRRLNTKDQLFDPRAEVPAHIRPILIVGTGMNSGKTTTVARLSRALVDCGKRVAILKVTGSVSHRDVHEFKSTGAAYVCDFSDYGFPSTYLCSEEELLGLYCRMLQDAAAEMPDAVLVEIADGVFQRETQLLLESDVVKSSSSGVLLTAACAPSALSLVTTLEQMGWSPFGLTGLITNSPLFVQELADRCTTPVFDTTDGLRRLANTVLSRVQTVNSLAG